MEKIVNFLSESVMIITIITLIMIFIVGMFYIARVSRFSEFNRAGIIGSSGRIENGLKFGILIGSTYENVSKEMESLGFEKSNPTKVGFCHGFEYEKGLTPHLWRDASWRKGTICIVTDSAYVRYVSWTYGMGYP
jgi:hypothetical protein